MRIPFDIKFRPQIESGEYKVFAHEHEEQEARIVCWDNKGEYPIVALVDNEPEKFDKHGRVPGGNRGGEFSLFIVTPEPELSEDEKIRKAILALVKKHVVNHERCQMEAYLEKQKDEAQKQFNLGVQAGKEEALYEMENEQKPLSTEETELNSIAFLEQLGYTCVPPGAEQKTAEWSEEDKKKITFLERLIRYNVPEGQYGLADGHKGGFVTKLEAIFMLKSLRPQPHWNPSKEQMRYLLAVINEPNNAGAESCHLALQSLYSDLKNL